MTSRSSTLAAVAVGAVLTACATPASSVAPSVMPIDEALVDNGGVILYVKTVG